MSSVLFKNALILNGESAIRGDLLVKNDRIASICSANSGERADRVIDCERRILMPALYNAHGHAAMTLFRGAGADLTLQDWLFNVIFPLEKNLMPGDIYAGTMLAAAEMLRFGTAGFLDMYFFMGEACKAAIDSGMRLTATWPSSIENQQAIFDEYNGSANGRIKVIGALHAEYTASPEDIAAAVDFSARNNVPVHVHVSETQKETSECVERRGKTPAHFLADAGLFDRGAVAAHGVWVNDDDIAIFREKNVFVSHCPVSNMKLACGALPLPKLLQSGVKVALGTDGCASNNNLNLFEEMRLSAILHKGISGDPTAVSCKEVFRMATETGARACGFTESGVIREGAKADIILLDTDVAHAVPMIDPYAHIAYSAQGSDVCLTMVDGKIFYENGEYTAIDRARVFAEARKAFERLS